jgi:hypothetical protein
MNAPRADAHAIRPEAKAGVALSPVKLYQQFAVNLAAHGAVFIKN